MSGRYLYCPEYDEATATCLVDHEYVEAVSAFPSLTAEEGAALGSQFLILFVSIWVIGLIRKAISDRVEG